MVSEIYHLRNPFAVTAAILINGFELLVQWWGIYYEGKYSAAYLGIIIRYRNMPVLTSLVVGTLIARLMTSRNREAQAGRCYALN